MTTEEQAASDPVLVARFWASIPNRNFAGCWFWEGAKNRLGYGRIRYRGAEVLAHRFSLLLTGRPLQPGLVVDHRCHNRGCVKPDHLQVVTRRENSRNSLRNQARSNVSHSSISHSVPARGENEPSASTAKALVHKEIMAKEGEGAGAGNGSRPSISHSVPVSEAEANTNAADCRLCRGTGHKVESLDGIRFVTRCFHGRPPCLKHAEVRQVPEVRPLTTQPRRSPFAEQLLRELWARMSPESRAGVSNKLEREERETWRRWMRENGEITVAQLEAEGAPDEGERTEDVVIPDEWLDELRNPVDV